MHLPRVARTLGGAFAAVILALGVNVSMTRAQSLTPPVPIARTTASQANARPMMVFHLSYYFLRDVGAGDAPPSGFSCPQCGSQHLITTIIQKNNQEFGSHWAVLLNPGDARSFTQFLQVIKVLNTDHVKFWIDAYTSDIEHYTTTWGYYWQEPSQPLQLQPPYHEPYAIPLSPQQLSVVAHIAPTTFVGIRFHEVPYRASNPKAMAVVQWVAEHQIPVYINGGPTNWNDTWEPFILQHPHLAIPLVNNNWIGALDSNWQWATALYQQHAVRSLGWSTQTFFILPLSKFQVSLTDIFHDQVPANPYFFYFAYQYSYGGRVFEVEPDQAIYSPTGQLTATGQRIVTFYRMFRHAPAVSPDYQLGQNAYGVIAIRQSGKNRASWMGPMNLVASSSAQSGVTTIHYTVSGLPADHSALLAIWNGSSNGYPTAVLVNGRTVPITHSFQGLGHPTPAGFWLGGHDLYIRTENASVQVQYSGKPIHNDNAPLIISEGALFHVLNIGGPRPSSPTVSHPSVTCAGTTVTGNGTGESDTVSPGQTLFCSANFSANLFPINYSSPAFTPTQQVGLNTGTGTNVAGLQAPTIAGSYDIVAQYVLDGTQYRAIFPVAVP